MSIDVSLVACVAAIVLFQYVVSARPSGVAPITGARREDVHLQRKLQHVGTGAMIYVALKVFDRSTSASVLLLFALLCYGLHDWRGRSNTVNAAYIKWFGSILRQHEVSRSALPGAYYFLLGSGLSLAVFPLRTARLTILHLSIGDPAAAFFGTLYGRHKLRTLFGRLGGNKSLEGSIGCFGATAISTFAALMVEQAFYLDMTGKHSVAVVAGMVSLAAGFGAAVAELLNLGGWDDNLTLPLLSGLFLQLTVGHLLETSILA